MITLRREETRPDGVFGELLIDGEPFCWTLEHSYWHHDGTYYPKLNEGMHKCVWGQHTIHSGPLMTFEITGVPDHSGILFHVGNFNGDSEGCVLLGKAVSTDVEGTQFITSSKETFAKFLAVMGTDDFDLEVV